MIDDKHDTQAGSQGQHDAIASAMIVCMHVMLINVNVHTVWINMQGDFASSI